MERRLVGRQARSLVVEVSGCILVASFCYDLKNKHVFLKKNMIRNQSENKMIRDGKVSL